MFEYIDGFFSLFLQRLDEYFGIFNENIEKGFKNGEMESGC